ncbi:hypothetical protein BGW37DRAFT_480953 [Umbelopsis sp. PMI_123]|nr:hypothetical protein BGW37DRAFT_480953 [Umbelopsis sp. PMI_123]
MDDNSSYAESLEWHDSLHDKSAPYFPWQSSDRHDLFVPEFDEEEITNITRTLVTPVPSKASADDLLVYPSYLRRNRQLGMTDRCESAQIFNQLKNEDADDSSDLMEVELDYEQYAFLREMDSPTATLRTPSPRRNLSNNENPPSNRNYQTLPALASKRYSIADTYETAAARETTNSQRSLYDSQPVAKRDLSLSNSERNDQETNKLHRAFTVSNPQYTEQRLHKRSNSNLLPRNAYRSRTDENLASNANQMDELAPHVSGLSSARDESKNLPGSLKMTSRGVIRAGQLKDTSSHSRSSSVQYNPNAYKAEPEHYVPRYSNSRLRESINASAATLVPEPKKPQVTFNLENGMYEPNQHEPDFPTSSLKQPSKARRWSTLGSSYDLRSDKPLPQHRRSIHGDKPRGTAIIRPTAMLSPTSTEFNSKDSRYRSHGDASVNSRGRDDEEEETYEELSRRLRSASIGSDMSQLKQQHLKQQAQQQAKPTQSKSAEVIARRGRSLSVGASKRNGRDRTISLPDETPLLERREREKTAQKSYLQSLNNVGSLQRLPQRTKMSRSLIPDFIGSSLVDISKEEEPMRPNDWSLKWPDEMLRNAKEEELQVIGPDPDASIRHSYARVSPSTTASSSSASNVSGDYSFRTNSSKTRSTSTSVESLSRFSTISETKYPLENSMAGRKANVKFAHEENPRNQLNPPSPTFSMYSEKPWITDRTGHYADEMYNQLGSTELGESDYIESSYSALRSRRLGLDEQRQANHLMTAKRSNRYSSPASMVRTPTLKSQFAREEYEKPVSGSQTISRRPSQLAQGSQAITQPAKELLATIRQRREKTLHLMSEAGESSRTINSRTKLPTANWN